ncbi:MAG: hypothetical protein HY677_04915 [Chloroflexi bacterium]|nr:hypothetical protein [Chloroflexota bacterium]
MTIRPKRKDPTSTKPVYLPIIPTKAIEGARGGAKTLEPPAPDGAVLFYTDSHIPGLDLGLVAHAFSVAHGVPAIARGELFAVHLASLMGTERRQEAARLANELAWARIKDPSLRRYEVMPHHGEIDYELTRLHAELHPEFGDAESWASRPSGVLYDGPRVQGLYREIIPRLDRSQGRVLILTNQLLAKWRERAGRWQTAKKIEGDPLLAMVFKALSSPTSEKAMTASLYAPDRWIKIYPKSKAR